MMYPIIMVAVGGLLLAGMFAYVIPQITQIFQDTGQELPFLTQVLIGISHALRTWWWISLLAFFAAVWGFRRWKQTEKGSYAWDKRKLAFPIFGPLGLMIGVSRFTRTLATLLSSGVPLLTALDITKNVLGTKILIEIIDEARLAVKEAIELSRSTKAQRKVSADCHHDGCNW